MAYKLEKVKVHKLSTTLKNLFSSENNVILLFISLLSVIFSFLIYEQFYKWRVSLLICIINLLLLLYLNKSNLKVFKSLLYFFVMISILIISYIIADNHYDSSKGSGAYAIGLWSFLFYETILSLSLISRSINSKIASIIKVLILLVNIIFLLIIFISFMYSVSLHCFITSDVLLAILQTNFDESIEFVASLDNPTLVILCSLIFLLFSIVYLKNFSIKIKEKNRASVIKIIIINLICISSVIAIIPVSHRNDIIYELNNTLYHIKDSAKYIEYQQKRLKNLSNEQITTNDKFKGVYVLVIGESTTRDHMHSYGYHRETTPWLSKLKLTSDYLVQFKNAYSCHTHTVPVLSYALTRKNQYNSVNQENNYSLIEVLRAAKIETVWLSNQLKHGVTDSVITNIAEDSNQSVWISLDTLKYDEELTSKIDNIKLSDNMLIIIHITGCHNKYTKRHSEEFNKFGEDNKVDSYDNAVLHNDYVLEQLFNKTSKLPNFKAFVYFSDHGEYPETNSGHNFGSFHPNMSHIPLFVIFDDSYFANSQISKDQFNILSNKYITNDLIFNFMLDIMGISYSFKEDNNSIVEEAYDNNKKRFRVGYNKYPLD